MNVALCQNLLRHAEQIGAARAIILEKNTFLRSDSFAPDHYHVETQESSEITLFMEFGAGAVSVVIRPDFDLEKLLGMIDNAAQAGKIAHAWGGCSSAIDDIFKRFQAAAPYAQLPNDQCAKKNKCSPACFSPECLQNLNAPLQPAAGMASALEGTQINADVSIVQKTAFVVENIFHHSDVHTLQYFDTCISQSIASDKGRIALPDYRFGGRLFAIDDHPEIIHVASLAQAFDQAINAADEFEQTGRGILMSPWAVGVLGHEASHIHIDVTRSGRLALNMSQCMNPPASFAPCKHNMALDITLERSLTIDKLMERLPDHSIYLDAPSGWIRRDDQTLDVRFQIVGECIQGRIVRSFKPTVLRFDLKKLWFYSKWAAKPYQRISLQCGNSSAVYQAPFIFFDIDAQPGKW